MNTLPACIYYEIAFIRAVVSHNINPMPLFIICARCGASEIVQSDVQLLWFTGSVEYCIRASESIVFCSHCVPFSIQRESHQACLEYLNIDITNGGNCGNLG